MHISLLVTVTFLNPTEPVCTFCNIATFAKAEAEAQLRIPFVKTQPNLRVLPFVSAVTLESVKANQTYNHQ